MRAARPVLIACLFAGLGAVLWSARAHLAGVEATLRRSAERTVAAELKERARVVADSLPALWAQAAAAARYDESGRMVEPAPPATAERFEGPQGTAVAALLAAGKVDRARAHARNSVERAAVLLRAGDQEAALREPALQGTELYYIALAKTVAGPVAGPGKTAPDDARRRRAIDEIAALFDGPSDRLGRALLHRLGASPVGPSRARRALLASWGGRAGAFVADGVLARVERAADGSRVLKTIPLADLELGTGALFAPLPEPYGTLAVRAGIDRARHAAALRTERRRAFLVYGIAAAILVAATAFALLAVERARRLARAKDDFVANVTHELKTPVANIRLYAESLHEGRVRDDDRQEFVRTILDESGRLDALVEGLLLAARGSQGGRDIAVRLDPRDVLLETEQRWRGRLDEEGFSFSVDAPELPPIRGDREALVRALGNLLDNARKYDREQRRVELGGSAANGHVRLTVRDAGPGIPVAARDSVLRPFTRLESADRKETDGVGLGLSLVQSCMQAHGGRVEIGGEDGAVVSLVLPVEPDHSQETAQ